MKTKHIVSRDGLLNPSPTYQYVSAEEPSGLMKLGNTFLENWSPDQEDKGQSTYQYLWVKPEVGLADLQNINLSLVKVIALWIPSFRDGRAYSQAFFLRRRLNYSGVLVAMGDVLLDQVHALFRVGFDQLALREDQSIEHITDYLKTNRFVYQTSIDQQSTIFERRQGVNNKNHENQLKEGS